MLLKIRPVIAILAGILIPVVIVMAVKNHSVLSAYIVLATLYTFAGFFYGKVSFSQIPTRGILLFSPFIIFASYVINKGDKALTLGLGIALAVSSTYAGLYIRSKWSAFSTNVNLGRFAIWVAAYSIAACLLVPFASDLESFQKVKTGAPEINFQLINGETVGSGELAGKVVFLEFWATWCGACNSQMPDVQALYEKYKDDPEVVFIAVNTSWGKDSIDKVRSFMADHNCTYPVAYDSAGIMSQKLGVSPDVGIPQTLILDKNWNIRVRHVGYDKDGNFVSSVSSRIENLLSE